MAKSKSSKRWLAEHFDDPYVRMAQQQGLRSRSAFKLLEIQEKYALIEPGMTVVDLGAAPGGWCQVAARVVGPSGRVVGIDYLGMPAVDGAEVLEAQLEGILPGQGEKEVLAAMQAEGDPSNPLA